MTATAIKDYTVQHFGFESDVTVEVFTKFENGASDAGVWDYIQQVINSDPEEYGLE